MKTPLRCALPCLLAVLALSAGSFPARAAPTRAEEPAVADDPFVYEAPTGWKPERIPFPLGFAPSLSYSGFEQLHFAPGMFDPKSENYFTYLFFWWVEGEPKVSEETLTRDLIEYYRGLCAAVGGPKNLKLDLTKVNATITTAEDGNPGPVFLSVRRFTGRINAFDPFTNGQAIALEVEITVWRCDQENRTVVFFCVSPRPRDAAVQWAPMRATLASFTCHEETPTLQAEGRPEGPASMAESRVPNDGKIRDDTQPTAEAREPLVPGKVCVIYTPLPEYTDEARANRIQGNIIVTVVFGASGKVKSAKVVRGLGYGLDQKAIEAP